MKTDKYIVEYAQVSTIPELVDIAKTFYYKYIPCLDCFEGNMADKMPDIEINFQRGNELYLTFVSNHEYFRGEQYVDQYELRLKVL